MLGTYGGLWRCALMILGAAGLLGAGGCASIMGGGGEQVVRVNSTPAGAAVKIDGHDYGVTPTLAKLTRKESHVVRLELAGYQPSETKLEKSLNPWVFGNILFGGVVGLVVDAVTGGMNQLKPDGVDSTLGPATAPRSGTDAAKVNVTLRTVQNRE